MRRLPVLLQVRESCASPWIILGPQNGSPRSLAVSGMRDGDILECAGDNDERYHFRVDGDYPLPHTLTRLRASYVLGHSDAQTSVTVDIIEG